MKNLITIALIALSLLQIAVAQKTYQSPDVICDGYETEEKYFGKIKSIEEKYYYKTDSTGTIVIGNNTEETTAYIEYDENKNTILHKLYLDKNRLTDYTLYTYKNNVLTQKIYSEYVYEPNGGKVRDDTIHTVYTTFNDKNQVIDTKEYDWENDTLYLSEWTQNGYTPFGKVAYKKYIDYDDHYNATGYRQDETVFSYDEKHNLFSEIYYRYRVNNTIGMKKEYKYDNKNRLIEQKEQKDKDVKWVKYKLDRRNNRTQIYIYDDWYRIKPWIRIKDVKYNTKKNTPTEIVFLDFKDAQNPTVVKGSYQYQYDHKGNWIAQKCFFDGKLKVIIKRNIIYYQ